MEYSCSRRVFLAKFVVATMVATAGGAAPAYALVHSRKACWVNDMHAQLNHCKVSSWIVLRSPTQAASQIKRASYEPDGHLAICGSRHAGGGQQFATGAPLLDVTGMKKVLAYDATNGLITVQSGACWPELIAWLRRRDSPWTFRQKQTGNDDLTIGGTLSANAHGQGLKFKPIIGDIEYFELMMADGSIRHCSRSEDAELFKLAIGGYGNFGLITQATLRLAKRIKYRIGVQQCQVSDILMKYEHAVKAGAVYGDFQCDINDQGSGFLRGGIWKAYYPVEANTLLTEVHPIQPSQWEDLVYLAHTDKRKAWEVFSQRLLSMDKAVNYSDFWQSSPYVHNYHADIDKRLNATAPGSEVLTELYVPLASVESFLEDSRQLILSNKATMLYSTVRFIERDDESFLPWARSMSACVIFNFHTDHDGKGEGITEMACRQLIDVAIKYGGSYYLTYHRYARKNQILACYPEFPEFLKLKKKYDPSLVFRSDWYQFYDDIFAGRREC